MNFLKKYFTFVVCFFGGCKYERHELFETIFTCKNCGDQLTMKRAMTSEKLINEYSKLLVDNEKKKNKD